jgi:hypothetical protein
MHTKMLERRTLPRKLQRISLIRTPELDEGFLVGLKYSLGKTGKEKRVWLAREVLADEVKNEGGVICGRGNDYYFASSIRIEHKKLKEAEEVYGVIDGRAERIEDYDRFMVIGDRMVVFYSENIGFVYEGGVGELIMNLVMFRINAPGRLHKRIDSILKTILQAIEAHNKLPKIPASA